MKEIVTAGEIRKVLRLYAVEWQNLRERPGFPQPVPMIDEGDAGVAFWRSEIAEYLRENLPVRSQALIQRTPK